MNNTNIVKGLISCIIPVFNRPDLIIECVESVLAQTYRNFEIIIIDDGSTDNSVDVLEQLSERYAEIIKLYRQVNQGPGAARQKGLNHASGEYVQFLDSDDLIKPEKFEFFMDEFNGANSPDIVYCITHYYRREAPEEFIVWKKEHHRATSILPGFIISRAWSTSTPIYRKALLDNAGEILPLSCEEDLEYDCRIGLQSPKIKFVNKHLTDFRGHRGQRFSVNNPDRARQLADQIKAREQIYQTMMNYKLSEKSIEFEFYANSMFLLARQSGEIGLIEQSKLALQITQATAKQLGVKIRILTALYQLICKLAGTKYGSRSFNAVYNRLHQLKNGIKHLSKPLNSQGT